MIKCSCCNPPRQYSQMKSLYRHERSKGVRSPEDVREVQNKKRREEYYKAPKTCGNCDAVLSYEDVVSGNKEKYCSRKCAALINSPVQIKRKRESPHSDNCIVCNAKRGRNAGLYCSNRCQGEYKFNTITIPSILMGLTHDRPTLKKYLKRQRGWQCEICRNETWLGETINLELDHINGDPSNNLPVNLRLICPNCHSMQPTSKGRNRGNGRKSRGLRLG